MSKASQLGTGRFGGGARPVSARRQAVAAATGVPTDGVAPPTELPPHRISLNPDNPRSDLGDLTDLAGSLRTHGQKQAITVMNRDVYIKANPEREGDLEPDTTYVVIDGSSRLAAAREADLPTIKVMVSDDQGSTSEELLESALVANIHRQDLDELDEARALERLLAIHGSQRALAKRLHRSQGWVSQRLALRSLIPALQARIGEEPIDLLRAVGNRPPEEQEAALAELKAQRAEAQAAKAAPRPRVTVAPPPAASGTGPSDYGVITDDTTGAGGTGGGDLTDRLGDYDVITEGGAGGTGGAGHVANGTSGGGVPTEGRGDYDVIPEGARTGAVVVGGDSERPAGPVGLRQSSPAVAKAPESVPEPRGDRRPDSQLASPDAVPKTRELRIPYDDGIFVAMHLIKKMSDTEFDKMLVLLNQHQQKRGTPPTTAAEK
ncbi:ParB/RepB/Spo0J family partition protein [Streptomyces sp. NPDC001046]|uniref:ParB/RepB/Spo0J family partition protein n=1 Tax=Streptomyces sp. NPDC001046 TaxID=3364543 RepID=UPI0036B056A6